MRRLLIFALVAAFLLALAGWGVLRYIEPREKLDLAYREVNVAANGCKRLINFNPGVYATIEAPLVMLYHLEIMELEI